jgi:phosphohistidine phosphatase
MLDELYMAEPERLMASVRRHGDPAQRLLLVGHNPGLQRFANRLAGSGNAEARARLAKKFPTAALARIGFRISSWAELSPGSGELIDFWRPRDLADLAG